MAKRQQTIKNTNALNQCREGGEGSYLGNTNHEGLDDTLDRAAGGRVASASEPFANSDKISCSFLWLLAACLDGNSVNLDGSMAEVLGHFSALTFNGNNSALDRDGFNCTSKFKLGSTYRRRGS